MKTNTVLILMAILWIVTLAFSIKGYIFIVKNEKQSKPIIKPQKPVVKEYHIKVECTDSKKDYVAIYFTNDNWLTKEVINRTFDLSDVFGYIKVVHQSFIFNSETEYDDAIELAKTFKTYEQAKKYNEVVLLSYKAQLEFRKTHPPIPKEELKPKVCKSTTIY